MNEPETQQETPKVEKSKFLYILHIVVPLCLMVFSSIGMVLSFLQSSTSQTINIMDATNISSNVTYELTTELSNQDKIIELLNLNSKQNQETLLNVICVFNFLFSCLTIVYSKMMNSESHQKGNKIIELITNKNIIMEQLTTLTNLNNSARPSVQYNNNRELWRAPLSPSVQIPSVLVTPNDNRTIASNSTAYIAPYNHEPVN